MAKRITPEEAALRKKARKARDRAWHARYRAMTKVENAGLDKIREERDAKAKPHCDEFEARRDELDLARRTAEDDIVAIRMRLAAREDTLRAAMKAAKEKEQAVYAEYRGIQNAFEAEIARQFPDMQGTALWSAAAWKPIEEFLE